MKLENYQHKQFQLFECQIPQAWQSKIIEHIPTFYDVEAGWCLQFVEVRDAITPQAQLIDHLSFYFQRNEIDAQKQRIEELQFTNYDLLACNFEKEERFWRIYMAEDANDNLLIILFNSDEAILPEFVKTLHTILESIQFIDTD